MDKTEDSVCVDYSKVLALLIKRIKFTSNRQNVKKYLTAEPSCSLRRTKQLALICV
jgi:hypothetical protein